MKLLLTTILAAVLAGSVTAQQRQDGPPPPPPLRRLRRQQQLLPRRRRLLVRHPSAVPARRRTGRPAVPAAPAPPAPPAEPAGQLVNIRVDLLLTDEGGPTPTQKNISLTLADRARGSVRATGTGILPPGRPGFEAQAPFNVDVYARLERDGRIRTNIVLEYRALSEPDAKTFAPALKGVFEPLLENGKKMQVWQAADRVRPPHQRRGHRNHTEVAGRPPQRKR